MLPTYTTDHTSTISAMKTAFRLPAELETNGLDEECMEIWVDMNSSLYELLVFQKE